MYNNKIMNLFANPKNVGIIQGASGVGSYTNEKTGNVLKIYLKVEDETVVDASFKAFAGAGSIAVLSVLTELVKGMKISEVTSISSQNILEEIGSLEEDQLYLVDDALETLGLTVKDYNKKQEKLKAKQN